MGIYGLFVLSRMDTENPDPGKKEICSIDPRYFLAERRTADMNGEFDRVWDKWREVDVGEMVKEHRDARERYIDAMERYITGGSKTLEVGCGSAIDSYIVASETGADAYGVDISEEALTVARKAGKHFPVEVKLSRGDAMDLAYGDEMFDIVFSQGVLEHLPDEGKALEEQLRVLKQGGVLVVNVPQKYTAYTLYKHIKSSRGEWEWGDEKEYSAFELQRFADTLRLKVLERFGYGYWRSPFEPVFVMRTLNLKAAKIPFARRCPGGAKLSRAWDGMWSGLEKGAGHFFMKNIVYIYRKPI
ncbi:MAG: methyltransferase domain-containing protein [Candidatus Omnitrophica bacterium]|nr:methyltransferase domain-containing protein [Candidatus Omnitrophota bacterium]